MKLEQSAVEITCEQESPREHESRQLATFQTVKVNRAQQHHRSISSASPRLQLETNEKQCVDFKCLTIRLSLYLASSVSNFTKDYVIRQIR